MIVSLLTFAAVAGIGAVGGTVTGAHGEPLAECYIALYPPDYSKQISQVYSEKDGAFTLNSVPVDGFLQVQPMEESGAGQMLVYPWQPRVYAVGKRDARLDLKTPPAVNYVIAAYGPSGTLMRWKDWEAAGKYGQRFLFATDARLRAISAQVYPVFGPLAGMKGEPRGEGLPAVIVEPGQEVEIHGLFWETKGYGRLQVSALPEPLKSAGDSVVVNWNHALARHAIARARFNDFTGGDDPAWFDVFRIELDALEKELAVPAGELATAAEAAAADAILVRALDIADRAALERGKRRAAVVRAKDATPFVFGVYQGSPFEGTGGYSGKPAYQAARDAGFSLATVLPAWGWAGPYLKDSAALETVFGTGALKGMGYAVKAHGVCWLQDFMDILPPNMHGMPHPQVVQSALNYQLGLVEALGPGVQLWEALNEPATTNSENFTREEMLEFVARSAASLKGKGKTTLVNSPHEFNYGIKHEIYTLDGKPLFGYPDTFATFLDAAATAKALKDIDVIGLQVYPGFHLAGGKPGEPFEGPAWTPAYFERMLNVYATYKKAIHVTEFSVPSSYATEWKAGYWKRPWDEPTQADYAEAIYTVAYGHPAVTSIGWWDITDEKPSVVTGGLLHADRTPKPVFNRLSHFISEAVKR